MTVTFIHTNTLMPKNWRTTLEPRVVKLPIQMLGDAFNAAEAILAARTEAEVEKMASPIIVQTRSGEKLKVYFDMVEGNFTNVYLEGKARLVYGGEIGV